MKGEHRYDVVLIALADVRQDARTLNLARALSAKFKVAVIGMGSANDLLNEPFVFHQTELKHGSALSRALQLRAKVMSIANLHCHVVGAMDLFAGPAALTLSAKCKAKIVYDAREFYFALASLVNRRIKQYAVEMFERYLLSRAMAVTVSGWLDADVIKNRYGLTNSPTVILNTPPFKEPVDSNLLRFEFGIPSETKIVLYQGVVLRGRGIEPFMKALARLDGVVLCVLGDGDDVYRLKKMADDLGVSGKVFWKGAVPYSELHGWTCSADVGLCLIEPVSLSYEYALPNKLFEYMMAGIPSLVSHLPALHSFIKQYPVGMLVGRDLLEHEIASATRSALNNATYNAMREQCKHIEEFCYERQRSVAIDTYYHASL